MKCTSCQKGKLLPNFIDSLFRAHVCDHCGGNWILIEDFLQWKENNAGHQFSRKIEVTEDPLESAKALLCPVTGTLMTKFRISANTSHRVDYSASTGGMWLDKGEWELLKQEGIAGSLNMLITKNWQNQVRREVSRDNFADIYQAKFGEKDYKKAREVRDWLQSSTKKADLRAYILADDPYKTNG